MAGRARRQLQTPFLLPSLRMFFFSLCAFVNIVPSLSLCVWFARLMLFLCQSKSSRGWIEQWQHAHAFNSNNENRRRKYQEKSSFRFIFFARKKLTSRVNSVARIWSCGSRWKNSNYKFPVSLSVGGSESSFLICECDFLFSASKWHIPNFEKFAFNTRTQAKLSGRMSKTRRRSARRIIVRSPTKRKIQIRSAD